MNSIICFLCGQSIIFDRLDNHFKNFHHYDLNSRNSILYLCGQNSCSSSFTTYKNYKKHLKKFHLCIFLHNVEYEQDVDIDETIDQYDKPLFDLEEKNRNPANTVSKILLDLKNRACLTTTNINIFTDSMQEVLTTFCEYASRCAMLPDLSEITKSFMNIINSCKKNANYTYVESKQIHLGVRRDKRKRRDMSQVGTISENFQFISLVETLKTILCNDNLRHCIDNEKFSSNTYSSYKDGEEFKKNLFLMQYPHSLRINLYYDELEVANPIGSKGGIHKVGMFYYTLQNLPYLINTSLEGIFLLAVAYDLDVKKYGFKKILKPFMNELEMLETDAGIQFETTQGEVLVLRALLVSFTGG